MAPTIKWQRWDSASYNWFGTAATDALPSLEAELDAWITAVNGNASNSGRSVTKERGYADSTSTNYAGLVLSCGANGNANKGYMSYMTAGSTTTKRVVAGDTYADNTTLGGYGTISGGTSDTSISWKTSATDADWLIVYDTTDGQEYFSFGPILDGAETTANQDGFFIFKCTDGEWSMVSGDGGSQYHIHYWDDAISTEWANCSRSTAVDTARIQTTYNCGRYLLYSSSSSQANAASPADGAQFVYAANPSVFESNDSTNYTYTGRRRAFTDLGDGNNVYLLTGFHRGPNFLIDLRS